MSSGGDLLGAYYLPVWFQAVQGTTPTVGGLHFLPSIGALVFGAMVSGALGTFLAPCTPRCCVTACMFYCKAEQI